MSKQKEQEIKRQFLEEANEYLGSLEAAVLGIANHQVETEKINAALRAAHSIKGGAGMMGFGTLSQLAHRLEDSFKVLKTNKQSLLIDAQLEGLLLAGIDCLRQVIHHQSEVLSLGEAQGSDSEPVWLTNSAESVFEQLKQQLGEPVAEDAVSVLSPEDGQEVIPLLFETEVEGCLQRLESVLADPQLPCLHEELEILAQELGGLGEMLQLSAFSQLCQSVMQQLAIAPERSYEIAQTAISAWRRSQALILTGQLDLLPCQIELPDDWATATTEPATLIQSDENERSTVAIDTADWAQSDYFELFPLSIASGENIEVQLAPPAAHRAPTPSLHPEEPNWVREVQTTAEPVEATELPTLEIQPDEPISAPSSEERGATVRVPVKYLDILNDLFGELTIERNGLSLQLKRLHSLAKTLGHRLKQLEQANSRLQGTYDQSAIAGAPPLNGGQKKAAPINALAPFEGSAYAHRFDWLEMDRYSDLHLLASELMESIIQIQEVASDIELSVEDTQTTARNLDKTAKQMQRNLNCVRMRPLSDILAPFPRALRELSLQHGKPVQLKITGQQTLVDRNILEALQDPLMHLLRNAFDHGIEEPATRKAQGKPEQGLIEIKASHRSNRTLITVKDDGRGIDIDKIRAKAIAMGLDAELLATASERELLSLIFEPGFTTKEEVTDLSGRGIGMDVVRNNLKQIRGEISVEPQAGVGTTFTISVPFTLSVTRVLLAETNGMLLAFPTDTITEMVALQPEQVFVTAGSEVLELDGKIVPLLRPERWLQFHCPRQFQELPTPPALSTPTALLVTVGNRMAAIAINNCWREQEVAIRQVEGELPLPKGFSSCAILGDGRVVPLVDVAEFLHWVASGGCEPSPERLSLPAPPSDFSLALPGKENTVLIVDDSINVRRFLALTLEKAGYRVEQARDGQDAIDKLFGGLNISAAICDIEMPHLDGYGFLAQVKANDSFKQLPVIMLTSRTSDKHRQLAMSLGAIAYFSKPYNEQALLHTLETVTGDS